MHRQRSPLIEGAAIYGSEAALYDRIYFDEQYYRRSSSFVLERLPRRPSILDLCAGTGSHTREFLAAGASVVAIDVSADMLAIARQKAPEARFVCADVRGLALGSRFDAVVCLYGSIHYIEAPNDIRRILKVAVEHLVPGGVLVFELRDHDRLSRDPIERRCGSLSVSTMWRPGEGAGHSDLYIVSAFDRVSGRHFVDVHHLFCTNPTLIVGWAMAAGLTGIKLHMGFDDAEYGRTGGGDAPVLVGRRPHLHVTGLRRSSRRPSRKRFDA